jgi:probable F420-dependent oxidoreductase
MQIDAMTSPLPLAAMAAAGKVLQDQGFAGLVLAESGRSALQAATAVALGAPGLHLCTGVAVAFPRSPMVTAAEAWELAAATGGGFRLGLGTQVRAHVKRRYSSEFDPPGPRLEEYVRAVRAIFAAFRGTEPLSFEGSYWSFSLLPDAWSPGPIDVDDPPVDVAAVNPWMLRMAGRLADGLHVHPLNHPTYLRETVQPELLRGAAEAGRSIEAMKVHVPCFTVVGDDEEERSRWRELARMQIAFYGSTPNYWFIFDQIGFEGVGEALRERQRAGDLAGMFEVIDDRVLAELTIECGWSELGDRLIDRFDGVADRVVLYFANPLLADEAAMRRFGAVAADMADRSRS